MTIRGILWGQASVFHRFHVFTLVACHCDSCDFGGVTPISKSLQLPQDTKQQSYVNADLPDNLY